MSRITEYLQSNSSECTGDWRKRAEYVNKNRDWLTLSRIITLRVISKMESRKITQKDLASMMGCTQQYVSSLLKGSTNMTLETICRLEKALEMDIVSETIKNSLGYGNGYLSDSFGEEAKSGIISSSSFVDGYDEDE